MKPEKKSLDPTVAFTKAGVRAELIPILVKLGHTKMEDLKKDKSSKLFNDVCGMRQKMKLEDVANPTLEEVEGWLA